MHTFFKEKSPGRASISFKPPADHITEKLFLVFGEMCTAEYILECGDMTRDRTLQFIAVLCGRDCTASEDGGVWAVK